MLMLLICYDTEMGFGNTKLAILSISESITAEDNCRERCFCREK